MKRLNFFRVNSCFVAESGKVTVKGGWAFMIADTMKKISNKKTQSIIGAIGMSSSSPVFFRRDMFKAI
jgi:hypothetical protein